MWTLVIIVCVFPGVLGVLTVGDDVEVYEGETAILECSFTDEEMISLTWLKELKNGTEDPVLVVTEDGPEGRDGYDRHSIYDNSSLKITDTEKSDSATYLCDILHDGGPWKDSLKLTVIGLTTTEPTTTEPTTTENNDTEGGSTAMRYEWKTCLVLLWTGALLTAF